MSMTLNIRAAEDRDLEVLERQICLPSPDEHRQQLSQQANGIVTYLVAWNEMRAVGYGLIHWPGPRYPAVAGSLPGCPEIFSLTVIEELRGRGIGRQLMANLESCVRDRHFPRVGLGVAIENEGALRLYRRLGYRDAQVPVYMDRWEWTDQGGQSHAEADACIFLIKDLR